MLVSEALPIIRKRISDEDAFGYDDSELISYINDAINLLWIQLVGKNSFDVIKRVNISSSPYTKPSDYYILIGKQPIIDRGSTLEVYGVMPLEICYFYKPSRVSLPTDSLPFNNEIYNSIIIQFSSVLALNRNEFDISQDKGLVDELRSLIP